MGSSGHPVFVSETRNLYRNCLNLIPLEDGPRFDLVQSRGDGKRLYEGCGIKGFELRINREETIRLKLDITGEKPPVTYPYNEIEKLENSERFNGDGVTYKINGNEHKNIYGVTMTANKVEGTKTELWIKRVLNKNTDIPNLIDEFSITAQLFRDKYPNSASLPNLGSGVSHSETPAKAFESAASMPQYSRHFGMFRIILTRLVLTADETDINCADAVIGPMRFYVAGTVKAEVFSFGEGEMQ
jgi:hypothetical protein